MKKFESALDTVIKQFGKKIITEKRFVSVLSDYNAFYDTPAIRSVMIVCVQEGFFKSINDIINKKSLLYGNDKRLKDAVLCVENYRQTIKKRIGNDELVDQVTGILLQKLFPDYTNENTNCANGSRNSESTNYQSYKPGASKEENYTLELILCSVVSLIAGNALYITYEENEWWMSGAFFTSTIIQGLLLFPTGLYIRNRNDTAKSLYLSILFVAMLNALMPVFLTFQCVADFYSNFTWDYDGETLYNLYKGKKYEGGVLVFGSIVMILIIAKWMIYVTNKGTMLDFLKFTLKKCFVILFGIVVIAFAFSLYLYGSISSYICYAKESAALEGKMDSEIIRMQKLETKRKSQSASLSFMGIRLGASISEGRYIAMTDNTIAEVSQITTSFYKNDEFLLRIDSLSLPECHHFTFHTKLNKKNVKVSVHSFRCTISSINISSEYGDEMLVKLYSEKYGEPTRDSMFIKKGMDFRDFYYRRTLTLHGGKEIQHGEYKYLGVDDNAYWNYRNCTIIISNTGDNITYIDKLLQSKESTYIDEIVSKKKKELNQNRTEQLRKDSIENANRKKEIIMQEKVAKQKQLNDI